MRLTTLSNWYDDVRIEVPGVPNPVMRNKIVMAATEVCKRSLASQDELDPVDIEVGKSVYELESVSSCLKIWRVMWVKTPEGVVLTQDTRRGLISSGTDWEQPEGEKPYGFVNISQDVIQIVPKPTKETLQGFTPYVAFIPDPRTKRLDEKLYYYYRELIVTGAVSKLLRMANTPWYDRVSANDREMEFQVELSKIVANTQKDMGTGDVRVAMRAF